MSSQILKWRSGLSLHSHLEGRSFELDAKLEEKSDGHGRQVVCARAERLPVLVPGPRRARQRAQRRVEHDLRLIVHVVPGLSEDFEGGGWAFAFGEKSRHPPRRRLRPKPHTLEI